MKNKYVSLMLLSSTILLFSGCEAIAGIFKAGVWSGVIMVAVVIALIVFVIAKMGKGKE